MKVSTASIIRITLLASPFIPAVARLTGDKEDRELFSDVVEDLCDGCCIEIDDPGARGICIAYYSQQCDIIDRPSCPILMVCPIRSEMIV